MGNEVYEKVKAIVVDTLSIAGDKIAPEARFRENLGADSLDLVELYYGFLDEFGGRISDDDARSITTVQGAVDFLASSGSSELLIWMVWVAGLLQGGPVSFGPLRRRTSKKSEPDLYESLTLRHACAIIMTLV